MTELAAILKGCTPRAVRKNSIMYARWGDLHISYYIHSNYMKCVELGLCSASRHL